MVTHKSIEVEDDHVAIMVLKVRVFLTKKMKRIFTSLRETRSVTSAHFKVRIGALSLEGREECGGRI